MKRPGLLLGFAPLIVYGILAGSSVPSVTLALGASAATTILVGHPDLRKGMILPWTSLCLFGSALFAIGVLGMSWIIPSMGILIYATLAAVTFGSIAAGIPFTLQYARDMVDPRIQGHPLFLRTNLLMTGVWGGAFSLNLILCLVALAVPGFWGRVVQSLTYAVLLAGIAFTLWFPERVRREHAPPPAGSPGRT